MTKPNTTYHPLGDYIRKIDQRNRKLALTKPMGINIDKQFMPSVANVIGTDMSNYKLVGKNQFACNLMHVGRDGKIPVAINKSNDMILVSPAYHVFEIVDKTVLSPDFLMMWFHREEFDREASFYTDADVRSGMDFNALIAMRIPVPPIVEQRAVVAEYEAVARRIAVAKRTIATLQATAQALYRKMFVDGIDKENLPEGWRWGTIGDYCKKMTSGGTPNRGCNEYWNSRDYRWLKTGEVHNNVVLDTEEYISEKGLNESSAKLIPKGSITLAMYCANGVTGGQVAYLDCDTTTNQACCNMICKSYFDSAFLYFHLIYYQSIIKRNANGAAQENLSQELIANQPIFLFDDDKYKQPFATILDNLVVSYKEIEKIKEIQTIILSGMGR